MYSYIKGVVVESLINYITLDNNGIGYKIYTANPFSFKIGEEIMVYIYQNVKEDDISLYGFKKEDEKKLFLDLINVKGVGPKMALPIVGYDNIGEIVGAIDNGDIVFLKKFPKVGDKVAKQIILDLQGKLIPKEDLKNNFAELEEALVALGYKKADIKKVVKDIDGDLSLEQQIKEALKLLLR